MDYLLALLVCASPARRPLIIVVNCARACACGVRVRVVLRARERQGERACV
jgi:hypothetical protein